MGICLSNRGGWERLVCCLVWTTRLRYQVALDGPVAAALSQPAWSSATVPQTGDTTPGRKHQTGACTAAAQSELNKQTHNASQRYKTFEFYIIYRKI